MALTLHRSLAGRYEKWARARVAAGTAEHLSIADVSGTEWPLFGSVFYLRAVEALQAAWEKDRQLTQEEPRVFARGAIDAAAALVADPKHAAWVKKYWGERYLESGNLFYRMLLISALTSHARLTQSEEHLALLRSQVETLAAEIDASSHGLLDDYPGQCYPTDVVGAIAAIRRADALLGTDHRAFAERAARAFEGKRVGSLGLVPYAADAITGKPHDDSRGCGNSWLTLSAPEIWPERAAGWYAAYERHFWQHDWLAEGFREFPRGTASGEWYFDVDAGPVTRGIGFAASAFGIGAARANGRFDHAYPLSVEAMALSWPLPGGRLLVPRLVSDSAQAPLLGEAAIFFQLTRAPIAGSLAYHQGTLPGIVWLALVFYFGMGTLLLRTAWRVVR